MLNSNKYQLLPDSDHSPAVQVNLSIVPPSSASLTEINLNENVANQDAATGPAAITASSADQTNPSLTSQSPTLPLPSELPSYSEALRLKKLEANGDLPPSYFPGQYDPEQSDSTRITIDAIDLRAINDASNPAYDQEMIGSECMFLSAFMIAFFFNWIGFFASICLLPNAAGKYGALSGFGLSMAKWVTIVRYQEWMNNMNDFQQKLFFWLFIFLGFYLFFRGLINYMTLKYRPRASIEYSNRMRNRWFGFVE